MVKVIHIPSSGIHLNLKRVVRSTIAADTLPSADGSDVSIYINKSSELSLEHGKRLEVIAYTDNQSLYDAAYSKKKYQKNVCWLTLLQSEKWSKEMS